MPSYASGPVNGSYETGRRFHLPIDPALPRAALVTGGARRLGKSIGLALAEAGFSVAVHCRESVAEGEVTAAEVRATGVQAVVLQADLSQEAAVAGLLPRAEAALGPIGVLVNNASTFERDEWDDATRASWDRHLEPNLRAPFVLSQAFARALPETASGIIINMLDERVWSLTPHFLSYTVSKSALWTLTRTMALALAPGSGWSASGPGRRCRARARAGRSSTGRSQVCRSDAEHRRRRSDVQSWPCWRCPR